MENKKIKFLKAISLFAFLFVSANVAKANYPATLKPVTVSGSTLSGNINVSLFTQNGNQICLKGTVGNGNISRGCLTIAGATVSGTTLSGNVDISLFSQNGNQICLKGTVGNGNISRGCLTIAGATVSGTTLNGNVDISLFSQNGNQICLKGTVGNGNVSRGCLTVTPTEYECLSGGTLSGTTCIEDCAASTASWTGSASCSGPYSLIPSGTSRVVSSTNGSVGTVSLTCNGGTITQSGGSCNASCGATSYANQTCATYAPLGVVSGLPFNYTIGTNLSFSYNSCDGSYTYISGCSPSIIYNLSVNAGMNGKVDSNPVGIASCTSASGTCSANFSSGTVVNLTATPFSGTYFTGWAGGCTGASNTCSVTMDGAKSVQANFCTPIDCASATCQNTQCDPGCGQAPVSGTKTTGECAAATSGIVTGGWREVNP